MSQLTDEFHISFEIELAATASWGDELTKKAHPPSSRFFYLLVAFSNSNGLKFQTRLLADTRI